MASSEAHRPASKAAAWACMARRMLRKPLAREGVRLACRPVAAMKAGSIATTCWGVSPSRPSISSASSPLVIWASESPCQWSFPSTRSLTTYTWDTQPRTLRSSLRSASGRGSRRLASQSTYS